jgi:FtsP/CotA-like multicopper oxidase with cupredoxin domain
LTELKSTERLDRREKTILVGVILPHSEVFLDDPLDEIRGLPALPGPQDALAVVAAGDRFLFLVQAGACPWVGPDLAVAGPAGGPPGVVVRWHASGSRIPAPPSRDPRGQRVTWAHPAPGRVRLADPIVLLDLLVKAVALAGHRMTVTHTDGYPVVPTEVDALLLSMGERYDVIVTVGDGVFPLVASTTVAPVASLGSSRSSMARSSSDVMYSRLRRAPRGRTDRAARAARLAGYWTFCLGEPSR